MQRTVQQLSLLEPSPLPPPPPKQPPLSGAALEVAMRQVFNRWRRWHRCKRFEEAVADPVTRRLLELTVSKSTTSMSSSASVSGG